MTATPDAHPEPGAPEITRTLTLARMNDEFRNGLTPGRFFVTPGVIRLTQGAPDKLIAMVRNFDAFDTGNDPHGEHDFGAFDWEGRRIFFKIDCFDHGLNYASPDPTDETVTTRCLTVMLSSEY